MLTPRQLEILQHALGLDRFGHGTFYRNHFCAGGDDVADCAELVTLGYMRSFQRDWLPYFCTTVTDKGKEAVRRESPLPPKLTRAQQQYRRFLEADSELGFIEWMRWDARRRLAQ